MRLSDSSVRIRNFTFRLYAHTRLRGDTEVSQGHRIVLADMLSAFTW